MCSLTEKKNLTKDLNIISSGNAIYNIKNKMEKIFHYYRKDKKDSIESTFSPEEIKELIFIHFINSGTRGYRAFYNPLALYHYVKSLPLDERDLYEVATEHHLQKLRFDVDTNLNYINEMYKNEDSHKNVELFENDCYKNVCSGVSKLWKEDHQSLTPIIGVDVYSSHSKFNNTEEDANKIKISLHIIVNVCSNYQVIKSIGLRLIENLPEHLKSTFDKSVYKKTQNFRLYGCSKKTQNRFKKRITDSILSRLYPKMGFIQKDYGNMSLTDINNDIYDNLYSKTTTWMSCLLTRIDNNTVDWCATQNTNIGESISEKQSDNTLLTIDDSNLSAKKIQKIKNKLDELGLSYYSGGRLTRYKTGYCNICKRNHENDNGYLFVSEKKYLIDIIIGCFRSTQYVKTGDSKTYKLLSFKKHSTINDLIEEISDDDFTNQANNISLVNINSRYLCHNIIGEHLNSNNIVAIKSGTGSGKSYSIKKLIEELINKSTDDNRQNSTTSEDKSPSIIILTYRTALAREYYAKYKDLGFELYCDIPGKITSHKLIIQIESLQRMDIANMPEYDYLLLDECNKTIEQFNSSFISNISLTKSIIQKIIKEANKIIVLDAFLNYNSLLGVMNIRCPDIKCNNRKSDIQELLYMNKEKLLIINNSYRHKSDRKHHIINNNTMFISKIVDSIANNEKIAIASNSKKQANLLYHLIKKVFDILKLNKSIDIYTGDISNSAKNKLSDINDEWRKDVIIYTSVVEAGNSFDVEWFDSLYCYFTNKSTNYLGCLQMMDRVRNIKSNNVYINIKATNAGDYLDMQQIADRIKTIKYASENNIFDSLSLFKIKGKEIEYTEDEFYNIFIRNKAVDEYSKANFAELLYNCWKSTGVSVIEWDNADVLTPDTAKNIKHIIEKIFTSKHLAPKGDYMFIKALVPVIKQSLRENRIDDIYSADLNILLNKDDVDSNPSDVKNADIKQKILSVYNIIDGDLSKEIIEKYGSPKKLKSYQTFNNLRVCKSLHQNNYLDKFKIELLKNTKHSEYTTLNTTYKNTRILETFMRLDITNLMYGEVLNDILDRKEVCVDKSVIENKVKSTLEYIRDTHGKKLNIEGKISSLLKSDILNPKIRFINQQTEDLLGIKILRANNKRGKYKVTNMNYVNTS